MIIKEHGLKGTAKWKNEEWELCGQTPNELYSSDLNYRKYADGYCYENGGSHKNNLFFEVRIINPTPSVLFSAAKHALWYQAPWIVDRVFWVYQRPIEQRIDNAPYTYYLLEPKESFRVIDLFKRFSGQNLHDPQYPMLGFYVPTECCQIAWTETSNGYSDHLRWRPEVKPTQEELDKSEKLKADANKLLETAFDISHDAEFTKAADKLSSIKE